MDLLGVTGHADEAGQSADETLVNQVTAPAAFYAALRRELRAGATMVITDAPVGASPGSRLTVLAAAILSAP